MRSIRILILVSIALAMVFSPLEVSAGTTRYYPSDNGSIGYDTNETVWNTVHNAAAGTGMYQVASGGYMAARYGGAPSYYYSIYRLCINFNTASIDDGATVTGAVSGLYGILVDPASKSYNVYGSTAADTLSTGDYDQVGVTAYSDTAISDASYSTVGYNTWTFNATGRAAVSKTGLTKICYREVAHDAADSAPTDAGYIQNYLVAQAGMDYDPYLEVTYTDAVTLTPPYTRRQKAIIF